MKITFLSAHKNVGPLRKSLFRADGTTRSYPRASKITSFVEEFDPESGTIKDFRDIIASHAAVGHAMIKGGFIKDLVNEPRRGQTDKQARTQTLVLDIDGMRFEEFKVKGSCSRANVKAVSEAIIKLLPKQLKDVSYVAVASSSFGLKEGQVSMHLHFILSSPVTPRELKSWVESLNFTQQSIYERLELTGGKQHLKKIIDPCVADNSHIIYVAPPEFGDLSKNPFADDSDRIIAVEKGEKTFDLQQELSTLNDSQAIIDLRAGEKLLDLQKKIGVKAIKPKYIKINVDGKSISVVSNPAPYNLVFSYEDHEFVRYNISGGDSNAYWVHKTNPEVVHCFKDEDSFLFAKADPQTYAEHVEKYGQAFAKVKTDDGVEREIERKLFQVRGVDTLLTLEYDRKNDVIVEMEEHRNSDAAANWMRFYGQMVPDPIPPVYLVMNPNNNDVMYELDDKFYINRFIPTKYLAATDISPASADMKYGSAWMDMYTQCPIITEIILHMLGDDVECFEHYFNWLAFIFQRRDKAETAWLIHGHEGTGKGLFFKRVVRPLFGRYAIQNTLQGIADDQFNGWMEDALLVMVDEFNMKGASSLTKTASMLKTRITEPTFMLRKMQQQQKEVRHRASFTCATNDLDALPVIDRRRFNISPRQLRTLEERLPFLKTHRSETDDIIEQELDAFATILRSFQVDTNNATSILENQAREDAQRAGLNAVDLFFEAVAKGDFDYFIEVLDKSVENMEINEAQKLQRAKYLITAMLPYVNENKGCYILKDDLRALYSYRAGKEISQTAFGRMLGSHELVFKRKSEPLGAKSKKATRPECIEVFWKYDDVDVLARVRAYNHQIPGVSSVQANKKPETQEELTQRMHDKALEDARALLKGKN